jgi:predicted transcriptional regulator
MKTSFPSLKVDPELRAAVEEILEPGETLSSFMEQSLRLNLERRQGQRDFLARGLASREEARRTGEYYSAAEVLDELDAMLSDAELKAGK